MAARVSPSRPGWRVLVVDDEPVLLLLLARFLESEGYCVVTASDGLEALNAVWRDPPDAVLLDLVMPNMDGWAFLRACRATPALVDLPVLVMSGTPYSRMALAELGVRASLDKPLDLDQLADAVQAIWPSVSACQVCQVEAGTRELQVFQSNHVTLAWQLCGGCWGLLESGFGSARPADDLWRHVDSRRLPISETEVRGYIAAGLARTART